LVLAEVRESHDQRLWRRKPAGPAAAGLYTVAQLAGRGIHPMTDDQIRAVARSGP